MIISPNYTLKALVKESLGSNEQTFSCQDCGFEIGRDWNAAINIKNTAGYAEINAWGDYVQSGKSMNQESLIVER
jgi:transposase